MYQMEIKLDNIPAVNNIAKAWKKVLSGGPRELKANVDFEYYGGLILAYALMKEMNILVSAGTYDTLVDDEPEAGFEILDYCVSFKLCNRKTNKVEFEILTVFSKDNRQVMRILCSENKSGNCCLVTNLSGIIAFIDQFS